MEKTIDIYHWIMPSIRNRSLKELPKNGEYNFRIEKAREQLKMDPVDRDIIIGYVNEFLVGLNMQRVANPHYQPKEGELRRIDYSKINPDSKDDIVWIKFTKSNYISVIGTSCDISFSQNTINKTTAGIINQYFNQEWDEDDVLIFPLIGIPEHLFRSDIESGVGNYLISKGVPILDFYSHNY